MSPRGSQCVEVPAIDLSWNSGLFPIHSICLLCRHCPWDSHVVCVYAPLGSVLVCVCECVCVCISGIWHIEIQ